MAKELTDLQKKAIYYLDRTFKYQDKVGKPAKSCKFIKLDKLSPERGICEVFNSTNITVPLNTIIRYCKEEDDAKEEALKNAHSVKKSNSDNQNT